MKRIDNKKNLYKSIILLVILVIGIGYAYLTSNLSITGSTEVVANTWNIHFENLNVTSGSVTASTPATIDSNETSIEYAITLSRPKEYYEFTVDVVNEGTLPGKVSISELSRLDATSSKVIDYSIKYTYGQPVNVGDILNGGDTKTIRVRVYYKDDITEDDFPENNLNLNLTFTLQYLQSEKDEIITGNLLQNLKATNSCITKYSGNVTDKVGITEEATNVYFDNCEDKRNIIFGGFCWQVIRTTETGGLKMIYNGEPVDGKCESDRENHSGIVADDGFSTTINGEYLYGNYFTYDTNDNKFTIIDNPAISSWETETYQNLLGKFTCKNNLGECDTIYNIHSYKSSTEAYVSSYTIGNTNYAQIGKNPYNAYDGSLAMAGYMYNKVYEKKIKNMYPIPGEYLYGNSVTYNNNTDTYILSGDTGTVSNWEYERTNYKDKHYTCWNSTGSCNVVSYIHDASSSYYAYYIDLEKGKTINDALEEELYYDNVNKYNSSIKSIIDNWYKVNLIQYNNYIEDAIYCNDRSISNFGGWNPNIDNTVPYNELEFDYLPSSLVCTNVTDQFALSNNKAKLTYPLGLLSLEEYKNISEKSLLKTGEVYWMMSPIRYSSTNTYGMYVFPDGSNNTTRYSYESGVRPVISLASFNTISSGTGSETDPWVID